MGPLILRAPALRVCGDGSYTPAISSARLLGKGKGNVDLYSAYIHETSLRRSGIARIVKGYQSFTCT